MTARTNTQIASLLSDSFSLINETDIRDVWDTTIIKDRKMSVKQFGAIGNGVTDDGAAIQACLDAASDVALSAPRGGGYAFIPAGTYMTSTRIKIPKGVFVEGEYGGTMVKMMSGANLAGIFYAELSEGLNGLRNITLHGNRAAQSGKTSIGLSIQHATTNSGFGGNSIFGAWLVDASGIYKNILIVDVDGIGLKAGGAYCDYNNVQIIGCNGRGFEISQNDVLMIGCGVHDCLQEGWVCFAGSGRYIGCYASRCGSAGYAFGVGFRVTNANQTFQQCKTVDTDGPGFLLQGGNLQLNGVTMEQACNLAATFPARSGGYTGAGNAKCAIEVRGTNNYIVMVGQVWDKFVGTASDPNLAAAVRNGGDGNLICINGDPAVLATPGTTPWVTGGTNTTIVHNYNG